MGGCDDPKAKVTIMVLKVDLDCCQCYKKVKRLLCKFPQIRNQVYDEKQNTVTITVVCCSPEKIRDKLCCKAGKAIKSIEIKEPDKPKPKPEDNKPKPVPVPVPIPVPKPPPTAVEPVKPKPKPAPVPVPVPILAPAPAPTEQKQPEKVQKNGSKNGSKKETPPPPKPDPKPKPNPVVLAPAPATPKGPPEPEAQWVPGFPPRQVFPVSVCCGSCYHGVPGGPCYEGSGPGYPYSYGRGPCPPGYYANRCDYFCEDNPTACSIM